MSKMTICVDFDGVIHSYKSGWKGIEVVNDPPVHGAFRWLLRAMERFDVQIYSSRSGQEGGIRAMQKWFEHWAPIEFMGHQPSILALMTGLKFPMDKPKPFLTIDDRALTFNGKWDDPMWEPEVLAVFKPWNKR
jgi:hypothetical protein